MKNKTVTINVMGTKVEIPLFQDCKRCGRKLACKWVSVAYNQPCIECKISPEYQAEQAEKDKEMSKFGITQAFDNKRVTGVFQGKGTNFYTNSKGNIVKTEPYKPLGEGKGTKA